MLLRYELKKLLNKRLNRILLAAALLLAVVFSCFAVRSFIFLDSNGDGHSGFFAARSIVADKNQWKGELTPEKFSESIRQSRHDWQSTSDITYLASAMLVGEFHDYDDQDYSYQAKPEQVASIYDAYLNNLRKICSEYGKSSEKKKFLERKYGKIHTPFNYEAFDSWETMFLYVTTYGIVLVLIIGFLTAGIFSEEFQYRTDSVFFSTRYGRGKAIHTKIQVGLITATLVYAVDISVLSAICFGIMGISGASASYLLSKPYTLYHVSFGQMYAIVVLGGYVASLLSASVSMLISSKTKTMSVAVCIPFVLFCVSPFIGRVMPFHTFFTLTPDQLTNIMNCAKIPDIYQIGSFVFRQIPFLIIFYGLISILMLPLVYQTYYKVNM